MTTERHDDSSEKSERPRKRFTITYGEKVFELLKENTFIFEHDGEDSEYDHIYQVLEPDPEKEESGICFFRSSLDNYEAMRDGLIADGFTTIRHESVTDADKETYKEVFGCYAPHHEEQVATYELTDRQEKLVRRFGDTILKMPDDLLYDEITSEHPRPHTERWV